MKHSASNCKAEDVNFLTDGVYRDHEIIVGKCNTCPNFIVDVRSDNDSGDMLCGYINHDLVQSMQRAFTAVDRHEQDKLLLINVPF